MLSRLTPVKTAAETKKELTEGKVATIYVTTATKPEYVRFTVSGHDSEQLNFSGINASVTIKAPVTSG